MMKLSNKKCDWCGDVKKCATLDFPEDDSLNYQFICFSCWKSLRRSFYSRFFIEVFWCFAEPIVEPFKFIKRKLMNNG